MSEEKPKNAAPKSKPKIVETTLPTPRELYHVAPGTRLQMKGFTASIAVTDVKGVPLEIDYRDPETGERMHAKFELKNYLGLKK